MVLEDLLKDETTKKFEMGDILIYCYQKEDMSTKSTFKFTKDYYIAVFDSTENITREVSKGLNYCYSTNGYLILNSININYDLNRIVGYLYERGKQQTN